MKEYYKYFICVIIVLIMLSKSAFSQTEVGLLIGKRYMNSIGEKSKNYNTFGISANFQDKFNLGMTYSTFYDTSQSRYPRVNNFKDRIFSPFVNFIIIRRSRFSFGLGINYNYRIKNNWNGNNKSNIIETRTSSNTVGICTYFDYRISNRVCIINNINTIQFKQPAVTFGISYRFGNPYIEKQKKGNLKFY
jgi:hypothetical protein